MRKARDTPFIFVPEEEEKEPEIVLPKANLEARISDIDKNGLVQIAFTHPLQFSNESMTVLNASTPNAFINQTTLGLRVRL